MIKILYIISDQKFGGGSRHLLDLIGEIDKKKFEPVLISTPSPILDYVKNIKTYELEMKSRIDLKAVKAIQNIISQEKPNLIHLHSTRAGLLGTYAAKNTGVPIIYTEHLFTRDYVPHNILIHKAQIFAFKKLSKYISKVVAVSSAVKKYLVDKKIFPENKIEVIYHGIKINEKRKIKNEKGILTIGSIGSLNELKGYKYLIEAMKIVNSLKIKNWKLEIIGDGHDRSKLEALAKKLHMNNKIKFLGQSENVREAMKNWDIYVQPSLSESFGLAAAEAMSEGIPVIATGVGGLNELIDEDSGFLVKPKDSNALSCAIMELAAKPELRQVMGFSARNRIEKYFSLDNMIKKTEKLYEEITKICA